jgi:pimeloyl-ACP methyl ester carboxylesterase
MAKPYTEELVYTTTEDGIELHGATIRPLEGAARPLAAIFVHGAGSRFYGPSHVDIGRALATRGYPFVTGNNRGNHLGARLARAGGAQLGGEDLLGGTLWERFEESPYDVAAWIDIAIGLGAPRTVLIGHSRGARKVVYYQAQRQDPRVAGLILASGGSVSAEARDRKLLALSERLVAEGRGHELLPWTGPEPSLSAQTYLSNARPEHDPYGEETPDPGIARVRCPMLMFCGTREPAAIPQLEGRRRLATGAPRVDVALIEGAVHSYRGSEAAVASTIGDWIDSLSF